jgi:hypothetical protein
MGKGGRGLMGNGEGEPYENFFLWRLGWIDGQKIERRRKLYPAILESSKSSTTYILFTCFTFEKMVTFASYKNNFSEHKY